MPLYSQPASRTYLRVRCPAGDGGQWKSQSERVGGRRRTPVYFGGAIPAQIERPPGIRYGAPIIPMGYTNAHHTHCVSAAAAAEHVFRGLQRQRDHARFAHGGRSGAMCCVPNGEHCRLFRAPRRAMLSVVFAAAITACLSGLAYEARAEEERLSTTGEIDRQIVIREHAGWNMDCDAIPHPALYLDEPPQHGRVCARIENIKIRSMYVGTESQCIGRMVRGVQLIYRPDPGYAGNDGLRYATRYPAVLRTVSVSVTVTAYASGTPTVAPSNIIAPTSHLQQSSGPIPACEELMF